jgi:PRTRC genetic system ThiF family protein
MTTQTIDINLDYLNARRLLLPSYDVVTLALVGCGGTGSWLAPHVVRVARLVVDKFQKPVDILFVDPDCVEEKNCYRQNFSPAEIGRNKAETLAFRYGLAWGLEIRAVPERLDVVQVRAQTAQRLLVLIGCVDNAAARKSILQAAQANAWRESRTWWLDCGNHKSAGQVLLGCSSEQPKNPYELPGLCSWLPLPSVVHPELLEPLPEEMLDTTNMSCADLAMLDSQGLAINARIAAEASDYLVRLLLTRDLCKRATYIDLASGTTRSKYIVEL